MGKQGVLHNIPLHVGTVESIHERIMIGVRSATQLIGFVFNVADKSIAGGEADGTKRIVAIAFLIGKACF